MGNGDAGKSAPLNSRPHSHHRASHSLGMAHLRPFCTLYGSASVKCLLARTTLKTPAYVANAPSEAKVKKMTPQLKVVAACLGHVPKAEQDSFWIRMAVVTGRCCLGRAVPCNVICFACLGDKGGWHV